MPTPRPTTRSLLVTGATLAGVTGVLALSPLASSMSAATQVVADSSATQSGDATPSTSVATSAQSKATPSASATPSPSESASTSSNPTPTTEASASADAAEPVTFTGDTYQSPYGPMQVQVTVAAGAITDIHWVQLPQDRHSEQINSFAAPHLIQEALAAQSAQVDSVSGASYTSAGFAQSLQSALDQAGV